MNLAIEGALAVSVGLGAGWLVRRWIERHVDRIRKRTKKTMKDIDQSPFRRCFTDVECVCGLKARLRVDYDGSKLVKLEVSCDHGGNLRSDTGPWHRDVNYDIKTVRDHERQNAPIAPLGGAKLGEGTPWLVAGTKPAKKSPPAPATSRFPGQSASTAPTVTVPAGGPVVRAKPAAGAGATTVGVRSLKSGDLIRIDDDPSVLITMIVQQRDTVKLTVRRLADDRYLSRVIPASSVATLLARAETMGGDPDRWWRESNTPRAEVAQPPREMTYAEANAAADALASGIVPGSYVTYGKTVCRVSRVEKWGIGGAHMTQYVLVMPDGAEVTVEEHRVRKCTPSPAEPVRVGDAVALDDKGRARRAVKGDAVVGTALTASNGEVVVMISAGVHSIFKSV